MIRGIKIQRRILTSCPISGNKADVLRVTRSEGRDGGNLTETRSEMAQRRLPGGTSGDGRFRSESAEHAEYSGIPEGAAESVCAGRVVGSNQKFGRVTPGEQLRRRRQREKRAASPE